MKIVYATITVFFWFAISHGMSVDSVTVDSVWNSDSSWYDNNGILLQRFSRDCLISFIPQGSGYASCTLKVSLDSGKTWDNDPNPLQILDGGLSKVIKCGQKEHVKARIFGSDRSNVVFKIIAKICTSFPPLGQFFNEGFEGNLSIWEPTYFVLYGDPKYPRMRITNEAAHNGSHSITSDSNMTALVYNAPDSAMVGSGIAGIEFFIMAKSLGQTNFTIEVGKNAGSSGGLGIKFGFGFSADNSVTTTYYDYFLGLNAQQDSAIAPIKLNKWYKCVVEVDFTGKKISYILDDTTVRTRPFPTSGCYNVDRVLVCRGDIVNDGPKSYFADDIIYYRK